VTTITPDGRDIARASKPERAESKFLRMTKDYWFLVTVLTSALASVVYMFVFQVTPWDTYTEIKNRREQVAMHSDIGYRLLERGHYQLAKTEFERSLDLDPLDVSTQRGRYLSELFLSLALPTWDAGVWSAVREPLANLSSRGGQDVAHIVEKYLGDVEYAISNHERARERYENALALNPRYLDALSKYGWLHYEQDPPDPVAMEPLFKVMTEVDPYNYRGFHGLGYALYMQAVKAEDADVRRRFAETAAEQGLTAVKLGILQLNVTMDFGEMARAVAPELSIVFHQQGQNLLNNAATADLAQVKQALGAQLLMSRQYVSIADDPQRRSWINYMLALDHLAIARRLEAGAGDSPGARMNRAEHDRLLTEARVLDPRGSVYPIYADQLAILDRLAPVRPAIQ
jgi:tetratricopeptide (TPR) repeat protein